MNTKHVSDRTERKELKRKARAKAPAKPKRPVAARKRRIARTES